MNTSEQLRAVHWRGVAECHPTAPELEMYRWVWARFSYAGRPLSIPFVGKDGKIHLAMIDNQTAVGEGVAFGWCEGARIAVLFFADGGEFPNPLMDEIDSGQWRDPA